LLSECRISTCWLGDHSTDSGWGYDPNRHGDCQENSTPCPLFPIAFFDCLKNLRVAIGGVIADRQSFSKHGWAKSMVEEANDFA
jgi:hypothetical protein